MTLSPGGIVAALLAATAVLLWSRAGRRRTGSPPSRWQLAVARARDSRLGRRVASRPDASPLAVRAGLVAIGGLAVIGFSLRWSVDVRLLVWLLLPPAGLAAVLVLGRLEPAKARRRRVQMVLDLPPALELLAAGLAAGQPLRSAVATVADLLEGPLANDLAAVVATVGLGGSEVEAWRQLRGHPVLGAVAVDLARSVQSGTRLAELLAEHARVARRLRHAQLEAVAKAVGVRCVVPMMICFLPSFLLVGVVPIVGSLLAQAFR